MVTYIRKIGDDRKSLVVRIPKQIKDKLNIKAGYSIIWYCTNTAVKVEFSDKILSDNLDNEIVNIIENYKYISTNKISTNKIANILNRNAKTIKRRLGKMFDRNIVNMELGLLREYINHSGKMVKSPTEVYWSLR